MPDLRPSSLRPSTDLATLEAENARLRQELEESRETLRAIRAGEIDALIVGSEDMAKVLTLGDASETVQILLDQTLHACALLERDGRIIRANQAFQSLSQMDDAALHDLPIQQLLAPASAAAFAALLEDGNQTETEADVLLRNAAGQRVAVSLEIKPIEGPTGPCLLLSDRTAEHRTARIVSEEILAQSVLEQIADAVIVCDAEGQIARISRSVQGLVGEDVRERSFDEALALSWRGGGDVQPFRFADIVASADARWEVERQGTDGKVQDLILAAGFLHDVDGALQAVVLTLTDISERRDGERALELADRRKDEFLAILAHELRNPLAPIANGIRLLSADQTRPEVRSEALHLMDRQTQNMIRLVDDLMDVSRITRGKIDLKTDRFRLAEVLKVASETSAPLIAQFGHSFTADPVDDDLWINGDFTRLTQVFSNLFNNAAKYSLPNGAIHQSVENDGSEVRIIIRDQGIGIRPEMIERIFDLFAQADHSLDRAQGGLGVGLTLVRNLVDMHNGRVEAFSDGPGKGSTFVVTLPAAPRLETGDAQISTGLGRSARSLKVLIVEDNPDLAQTNGWLVESMGHQYTMVHNGKDALDIAQSLQPDVVLLDIGLPGMSGYDVCRHLRQIPALASTLFIAQTGWGQEEHKQMATAAGFHHHMVKPIDYDQLQNLLSLRVNA